MQVLVPGNSQFRLNNYNLDLGAPLVFVQRGVLSPAECEAMIARADAHGFDDAPITTHEGFVRRPEIRNNTRVMFDDTQLAALLFQRIAAIVPPALFDRVPVGVNERFRCYRYRPGQYFKAHFDGYFERDRHERSELTFMVYLDAGCAGGETEFSDFGVEVVPEVGMALLFQHALLHCGKAVASGVKHVLRSDVMYRNADAEPRTGEAPGTA